MDIWRHMPPLAALRAFSTWAEAGSMTEAGARLDISHAAISQHLRGLEAHLGVALVDRSGPVPVPTAAGRRLADAAGAGFAGIARVVQELVGADADRPVQVTTTPSFAAFWLVPRLARFRALHPEVGLMIDPTPEPRKLAPGGIDIALRYGSGTWPGVEVHQLARAPLVVVAAPSLVGGRDPRDPGLLSELPWLQEQGTNEASEFLKHRGLEYNTRLGLTSLPGNLMLDAARNGQGVAVTARLFVERDLAAGRLVLMLQDDAEQGYWLVTRPEPSRQAVRAFTRWVLREAAQSVDI